MKTSTKSLIGACFVLALVALGRPARADGVVLAPGALAPQARTSLAAEIAAARAKKPAVFRAVRAVDTFRAAAVKRSRNNRPTAARAFMRLGRDALLPMLELLVWNADVRGLDLEQRRALGDGLLQAVAFARDPRALPVLEAVFTQSDDLRFATTAATGLGMLCGDTERALLTAHAAAGDPRRPAAIAGLGHCRSIDAVETLANVLSEPLDDGLAVVTARALGYVGSSWALGAKSPGSSESEAIRAKASAALVAAFARFGGDARTAIARSLLMVEHPSAVSALRALEGSSSGDLRRDAKRLRTRLEKNLARAQR